MGPRGMVRPKRVEEAVAYAAEHPGGYILSAGNTDIMVQARACNLLEGKLVIDLTGIDALRYIRQNETELHIGALVTHAQLAQSKQILQYATALAEAARTVGSPQIRNLGTLAGNVANASPAADTLAPLAVLHGRVVTRSASGSRTISISDFILGPNRTMLEDGELICEIVVDRLEGYCQGAYKLGRREALSVSRLSAAAAGLLNGDGTIQDLRLTLGSAFPRPVLFEEIGQTVCGRRPDLAVFSEAAERLAQQLPKLAGMRPSTQYKQQVGRNLCLRLLCRIFHVEGAQ